ncbi:hypothetical protein IMCC14465_05340 [alpha proteobacterium IMCC14465]|uniref:Lytic murein transglycosylase n=1 Tax=alpha proteobacterium IMCC14465 TaxID=1220535 RepID=J9A704_9PROT|nr:hypothetical protein IMCC14465_05340 [alpha proteobacterium IMCC14465]
MSMRLINFTSCLIIGFTLINLSPDIKAEPRSGFNQWLSEVEASARAEGLSEATLQNLSGLEIDLSILALAARQPEYVKPIWDYLDTMVSDIRLNKGKDLLAPNKAIFDRLEKAYGVNRYLLTAIWGMETNYGGYMGKKHVLRALATLGYDGGRRKAFGRQQLIAALKIIEAGDIPADKMFGSWAGAMGQTQFIPTTYLDYAVDATGDGKRDIWNSREDALGSAANYLKVSGWRDEVRWGYEVTLPAGFDFGQADLAHQKKLSQWHKIGVRGVKRDVPQNSEKAALYLPAGYSGPAFLVTDNFRAILRYNTAPFYALAIGILSDRLAGEEGVQTEWLKSERPLHPAELKELQKLLTAAGYPTGKPDGMMGKKTRDAIRSYQRRYKLQPDGYATPALLEMLTKG